MLADSNTALFIPKPPEIPLSGMGAFGPCLKIVAGIFTEQFAYSRPVAALFSQRQGGLFRLRLKSFPVYGMNVRSLSAANVQY